MRRSQRKRIHHSLLKVLYTFIWFHTCICKTIIHLCFRSVKYLNRWKAFMFHTFVCKIPICFLFVHLIVGIWYHICKIGIISLKTHNLADLLGDLDPHLVHLSVNMHWSTTISMKTTTFPRMPTITLIQLLHHLADLLGDLGPHLVPSDDHEHKLPNNHRYNFGLILEMLNTLYTDVNISSQFMFHPCICKNIPSQCSLSPRPP